MKTIYEHLQELPSPYREQAIQNTERDLSKEASSTLKNELAMLFLWHYSNEGYEYWANFTKKL